MGDIATYNREGTEFVIPTGDLARDLETGEALCLTRFNSGVVRAMPDAGERILRFIMATPGVKRDGHSLDLQPDAWVMDHVQRMGGLPGLWGHDMGAKATPQHAGRVPTIPIGKWENIEFVRSGSDYSMVGDLRFGSTDLAKDLYRAYLPVDQGGDGICDANSLDWRPLDAVPIPTGFHFTRNEPLEGSLVPVGADPEAIIQRGLIPAETVDAYAKWSGLADESPYVVRGERGYRLSGLDPIERSDPEPDKTETATEPEPDAPSGPQVRHVDGDSKEALEFSPKDGEVGFVLVSRGAKATAEQLAEMAAGCARSLETRKAPELLDGWRAIPVVQGRSYTLDYQGDGDEPAGAREKIQRGLEESIEAGDVAVMSGDWQLNAVGRSARTDALDLAYAQLSNLSHSFVRNVHEFEWEVHSIFHEDEIQDERQATASLVKHRVRTLNLLDGLHENAGDLLAEIRDLAVPEPVAVEPIVPVAPATQAASAEPGVTRSGKKYSKARLKKLREAHGALSDMLEEAEAEADASDTGRSAEPSAWGRLAQDLSGVARSLGEPAPAEKPEPEPEPAPVAAVERTSPLAALTREMKTTASRLRGESGDTSEEKDKPATQARSFSDLAKTMKDTSNALRSAAA